MCVYFEVLALQGYTGFRRCIKDMSFLLLSVTLFILKFECYTVTQDFQRYTLDMRYICLEHL